MGVWIWYPTQKCKLRIQADPTCVSIRNSPEQVKSMLSSAYDLPTTPGLALDEIPPRPGVKHQPPSGQAVVQRGNICVWNET